MTFTNTIKYFLLIALFLVLGCSTTGAGGKDDVKQPPPPLEKEGKIEGRDYVAGRLLVKYKEDVDETRRKTIEEKMNLAPIQSFNQPGLYLMKILDGTPVVDVMEKLKQFEEIQYSEPDHIISINSN